ncbi:MAG: hypothetical protein LUH07_03795, partial [Lachnospiraceae bacterium]|nr:hypothetical protein [Lachnospiraceae bacterium]
MEELHNHTKNAEKFKSALDKDASIYQQREEKSARERLSEAHGWDKVEFIAEYYGITILIVVIVLVVVIQFVYGRLTSTKTALNVVAINAAGETDEEYEASWFSNFLEENGINTSKYEININRTLYIDTDENTTSYGTVYSTESLVTVFGTGSVDLFFANDEYFETMASLQYAGNLETYLTEEEIASIDEDRLVYVTIADEEEDSSDSTEDASEEGVTILAGIRLYDDDDWLNDLGWYTEGVDVTVGIASLSENTELATTLLKEIGYYSRGGDDIEGAWLLIF